MIEKVFTVQSLEKAGSFETDHDVGIVRLNNSLLAEHFSRGALVSISSDNPITATKSSIVRIARGAPRGNQLSTNQIALQYDDRLRLGIRNAGEEVKLRLEPVGDICGLPRFLLGHPSPLVRRDAYFAIGLMVSGVILGGVIGVVATLTLGG